MIGGLAFFFLFSLFAGLYLLARAIPKVAYRRAVLGLAFGPSLLWALLGLGGNGLGLILGLAAGLAVAILALGWLAARVAGNA